MKILKELKYRCTFMRPLSAYLKNNKGIGLITGAVIGIAAGVASGAVSASGAKAAAKTTAEASDRALQAQQDAAAKAERQRLEAIKIKERALAENPYPTYLSIPEAQQYKKTLEDRMAGLGLIDVNAQTAPVAAQVRAGLQQTNAAIGAGASARGLGRSSVATSQLGAASQAAERDIAERMQQLELVKQEQVGQAVSQFGTLSEQETASQQNKAIYQTGGEFSIANTMAGDAEAAKSDQFTIAEAIKVNGAEEAAWQVKNAEIWASAILGATKSLTSSEATDEALEIIKRQQLTKQPGAMVNIGNSRLVNNPNVSVGQTLGGF